MYVHLYEPVVYKQLIMNLNLNELENVMATGVGTIPIHEQMLTDLTKYNKKPQEQISVKFHYKCKNILTDETEYEYVAF